MTLFLLALTLVLPASASINDGLYSYYAFDSDAADALENNHLELKRQDAIVTENAACGSGFLTINGADDVLALVGRDAYGLYFDDDEMTVALWIRPDAAKASGWGTIVGFGTGGNNDYFRLVFDYATCQIAFYFQSTGETYTVEYPAESPLNLKDGEWHHVAFTAVINEAPVFYIDGKAYPDDVEITRFIGDPTGGYFVLGAMNDMVVDVFLGGMDDFRIYTRALSADEIAELVSMKGTTPEAPTVPVTTQPPAPVTDKQTDPPVTTERVVASQTDEMTTSSPASTEPPSGQNGGSVLPAVIAVAVIVIAAVAAAVIVRKKINGRGAA